MDEDPNTNTVVVLNPAAGSVGDGAGEVLERRAADAGWELRRTERAGDGERLAREAVAAGAERVLAAGGDGTVSEVLCGLMDGDGDASMGVIPLGTGNDLARTLGLPLDVEAACAWLAGDDLAERRVDVIEVRSEQGRRWALNSFNGGVADQVRERLDPDRKARWGPLAFTITALEMLGDIPSWSIRLRVDEGAWVSLDGVVGVLVANAPTVGGGLRVAPNASIEDARLDVVAASAQHVGQVAHVALRTALGGTPLDSDHVAFFQGRRVELEVPDDFAFTVDGEAFEGSRVTARVHPAALSVVVGPDYEPG